MDVLLLDYLCTPTVSNDEAAALTAPQPRNTVRYLPARNRGHGRHYRTCPEPAAGELLGTGCRCGMCPPEGSAT